MLNVENIIRTNRSNAENTHPRCESAFAWPALLAAVPLAVSLVTHAEHTRRWRQSTYEEFLKGTAKGVAVRSDGHLELAPKFTLIADADASYLWSLRTDSAGVLYAAGGSPAKVFRFEGTGKAEDRFRIDGTACADDRV